MSINYYARCASHITHKPKRKQEKKTAKKKKKESHYFKGARIGMQGFWKKNTTSFIQSNQTTEKRVWRFFLQNTF